MSTRSNIIIKDKGWHCILYRHCDGYPEGAGVELRDLLAKETFYTGEDLATHLIQTRERMDFPPNEYFPYELAQEIQTDIEYLYVIDIQTRTVECYSTYGICDEDMTWSIIAQPDNLVEIPAPKKAAEGAK